MLARARIGISRSHSILRYVLVHVLVLDTVLVLVNVHGFTSSVTICETSSMEMAVRLPSGRWMR